MRLRFQFRYGKKLRFLRFWFRFRKPAIFVAHLNGKVLEVGILGAALGPEALVHELGVGALLLLELELQLLPAPLLEEGRHHAEVRARHRQRPVETERLLSGRIRIETIVVIIRANFWQKSLVPHPGCFSIRNVSCHRRYYSREFWRKGSVPDPGCLSMRNVSCQGGFRVETIIVIIRANFGESAVFRIQDVLTWIHIRILISD